MKRILLFIVFVFSLLYCDCVKADNGELFCIYRDGEESIALLQKADGSQAIGEFNSNATDANNIGSVYWENWIANHSFSAAGTLENTSLRFDDSLSFFYDKSSHTFTECPKYAIKTGILTQSTDWRPSYQTGSNATTASTKDYDSGYLLNNGGKCPTRNDINGSGKSAICDAKKLSKSYNYISYEEGEIDKYCTVEMNDSKFNEYYSAGGLTMDCIYGVSKVRLVYGEKKILIRYTPESSSGISYGCSANNVSVNDLNAFDGCPTKIYAKMTLSGTPSAYGSESIKSNHLDFTTSCSVLDASCISFDLSETINIGPKKEHTDAQPIESCKDLIGEDFIEKLNRYLNIIKIAVPIILIGFGVLDFSKAMFSGEDDMKKTRKKFFLRILAAVLFFLLPIFVNLVLNLANNVWSEINADICIK